MMAALRILLVAWALVPFGLSAHAQSITVTAGEHADFTRLVVAVPRGTPWTMSPDGRDRDLVIGRQEARFDLARLFLRIPRTRLAGAQTEGPRLSLALACDCPLRAWEERPGLIVIDISDPPASDDQPLTVTEPPQTAQAPAADRLASARLAGEALARILPPPAQETVPEPGPDPRLDHLAADLGRGMAEALGQGLLEPATDRPGPDQGILPATAMPAMLDNMRIAAVTDRPNPEAPPEPETPAICQGADILETLIDRDQEPFAAAYGRLTAALYGEFDQPDSQARLDLIALYLASGFGAEARALIENASDPVAGRDLALGMADVLEDRTSNSRMRLAQAIDCGGAASVLAALADAAQGSVVRSGDAIALSFSRFPAALRAMLGPDLVQRLVAAGAVNAARIVTDSLERSGWADANHTVLARSMLDRARGHPADAADRLNHQNADDAVSIQARLDIALETGAQTDTTTLDNAAALAATARDAPTGPALMASVIRLHARNDAIEQAFAALDRLESWVPDTGENRTRQAELRDEVWRAVAAARSDLDVVQSFLAREDWRSPDLTEATRIALAHRLLDLGLATPIEALIDTIATPEAQVIRARAALATGAPGRALTLLSDAQDTDTRMTRAAALAMQGDHATAAAEFAALGITDSAARNAILAGEWRTLEGLDRPGDEAHESAASLGAYLGQSPGHTEYARSIPPPQPLSATDTVDARSPRPALAPDVLASPSQTLTQPAPENLPTQGAATPESDATPPADRSPAVAVPRPEDRISVGAAAPRDEGAQSATQPDRLTLPDVAPGATPSAPPLALDAGAAFDRLGLVRRSSTLLAESERLRDALAPLVTGTGE